MYSHPSHAVKQNGYALIACRQCGKRQRVEIGGDPEGWIKVSTVRNKRTKVLCPDCAGGLALDD